MAKLNVTYPAVDVMVNGQAYRKVDRKAQAGDIVKALSGHMDVAEGAFYAVYADRDGEPAFKDDVGDERCVFLDHRDRYETFAPVSSAVTAEAPVSPSDELTFEGAQYRKVNRSARAGDVIVFTEEADYITEGEPYVVTRIDGAGDAHIDDDDGDDFDTCAKEFDVYEKVAQLIVAPAQGYVEVKRKAAVGERIKIVEAYAAMDRYVTGDEFTVKSVRNDGAVYVEEHDRVIAQFEYVVLEPVTAQPQSLTVGDYAKVIGPNDNDNDYEIGTVVQIAEDWTRGRNAYTRAKNADGSIGNYIREYQLEPATEAEFLAAKAELQRKPAEPVRMQNGDYVKVTDASGAVGIAKVGDIAVITNANWGGGGRIIDVKTADGRAYGMLKTRFTPATPEEVAQAQAEAQRKVKEAQETAKWNAIGRKVGEFKRGDIVKGTGMHSHQLETGAVQDVGTGIIGVNVFPSGYSAMTNAEVTLIVPVEQRFDTEQAAA